MRLDSEQVREKKRKAHDGEQAQETRDIFDKNLTQHTSVATTDPATNRRRAWGKQYIYFSYRISDFLNYSCK